jgi:hypothetical protein
MKNAFREEILLQIKKAEEILDQMGKTTKYKDYSDIKNSQPSEFISMCENIANRLRSVNTSYLNSCKAIKKEFAYHVFPQLIPAYHGVLQSIKFDIENNMLRSFEELINANLFSDFLEMAEHLLEENYKDPAAVIIGSTLEEHIRKLAQKNGISIELPDAKGNLKPKKADALNSELAAANAYTKLDQKNVTSWLGLRNEAAHGNYNNYTKQQVELFLQSVRDFITRNPA